VVKGTIWGQPLLVPHPGIINNMLNLMGIFTLPKQGMVKVRDLELRCLFQ